MISNSYKLYCCENPELIENYFEAINSKDMYVLHHRLEFINGIYTLKQELINTNLYYNRPASELIYLTKSEHAKLHASYAKISMQRPEVRETISKNTKLAMQRPEVRAKFLDAMKSRDILGSNNPVFGYKWMNNGTETIYVKPSEIDYYISLGYKLGTLRKPLLGKKLSADTINIFKSQRKGRKWMNNGTVECFTKPDDIQNKLESGFVYGRLKS